MLRFLVGLQVTNKRLNQDIAELQRKLEPTVKEVLVPWGPEEIELLSLNRHSKKIQKGFHKAVMGTFNSIYFEPMIAFAYKEYYNMSRRAIIVARTDDHEFIYKIKTNRTEVFLNGRSFGLIQNDKAFINVYRKKIGQFSGLETDENFFIHIADKHVATMLNPSVSVDFQQRLIQLFQNLTEDQEQVLLAMIIPELITRSYPGLQK